MCGRFTVRTPAETIASLFGVSIPFSISPRYNIAPTQSVPVLRVYGAHRELSTMHWGLIPAWSKEPKPLYGTINARAETLAAKPAFRSAYKSRRCLVIADG
jgi:putative SOS response-associated peptidase YedK